MSVINMKEAALDLKIQRAWDAAQSAMRRGDQSSANDSMMIAYELAKERTPEHQSRLEAEWGAPRVAREEGDGRPGA